MRTSWPRTFSKISTVTSPSLKRPTFALPKGIQSCSATFSARVRLELPLNRNNFDTVIIPTSIMAGMVGFEPTYAGIKTPCLTAWRHPNAEGGILQVVMRAVKIFANPQTPDTLKLKPIGTEVNMRKILSALLLILLTGIVMAQSATNSQALPATNQSVNLSFVQTASLGQLTAIAGQSNQYQLTLS